MYLHLAYKNRKAENIFDKHRFDHYSIVEYHLTDSYSFL